MNQYEQETKRRDWILISSYHVWYWDYCTPSQRLFIGWLLWWKDARKRLNKTRVVLIIALVILITMLWVYSRLVIFEDGSWMLGVLHGCMPWRICNL